MDKVKTISKIFLQRIKSSKEKSAVGHIADDRISFYSFLEYKRKVESLSHAFIKYGLKKGTKVSVLASTSLEWHLLDLAILCSSGVVVPLHTHETSENIHKILNHSESEILIVENSILFNKIVENLEQTSISLIIFLNKVDHHLQQTKIKFTNYQDFFHEGVIAEKERSPKFHWVKMIEEQDPDSPASILYSIGKDGEPLGALMTHHSLVAALSNIKSFSKTALGPRDRNLILLPLSYAFGRICSYFTLIFECETVFLGPRNPILPSLKMVRPSFMPVVPAILKKMAENLKASLEKENFLKKRIFSLSSHMAEKYYNKIDLDLSPSPKEIIQYKLAEKWFFAQLHQHLGGRLKYIISGGEVLSPEIFSFFRNLNLSILEGFGKSETWSVATLNPPSKQISPSAGIPIGDVQIKFSAAQEILIKTGACFKEYFKEVKKTKQVLQDGWFHTGVFGHFNSDGYLILTSSAFPDDLTS